MDFALQVRELELRLRRHRIDGQTGFIHDHDQVLVNCNSISDNQYILQETQFKDLDELAENLSDLQRFLTTRPSAHQSIVSPRVLFVHGAAETIAKFLLSIGIEQHIVTSYCNLAVAPCEDHVCAFQHGESSFFKVKNFATSSAGSFVYEMSRLRESPHKQDLILLGLEKTRKDEAGVEVSYVL